MIDLRPGAIENAAREFGLHGNRCPACRSSDGTIEEGPAGATYSVPCRHTGAKQRAERVLQREPLAGLTDEEIRAILARLLLGRSSDDPRDAWRSTLAKLRDELDHRRPPRAP